MEPRRYPKMGGAPQNRIALRHNLGTIARRGRHDSQTPMKPDRIESNSAVSHTPEILVSWLAVFRPCFTAPGKRTVTQALRVMGLAGQTGFGRYHEVLNRARWDSPTSLAGCWVTCSPCCGLAVRS